MLYYFKDKYKLLEGKLEVKDVYIATCLIVTKWNFTMQAMLTWPGGGGGGVGAQRPFCVLRAIRRLVRTADWRVGVVKFLLEIY
jgi:hypothetical protein